jgi:hypothetical protein
MDGLAIVKKFPVPVFDVPGFMQSHKDADDGCGILRFDPCRSILPETAGNGTIPTFDLRSF